MADIFLSYAHEDREAVRTLANRLKAEGWSVWWDYYLPTGERYDSQIEAELNVARCVVVVWSRHSVPSVWVRAEADAGRNRKILRPVRIDDSEVSLAFRLIQTVDLSAWRGEDSPELLRLIRDVTQLLTGEVPPEDTVPPLPVEAALLSLSDLVPAAATAALGWWFGIWLFFKGIAQTGSAGLSVVTWAAVADAVAGIFVGLALGALGALTARWAMAVLAITWALAGAISANFDGLPLSAVEGALMGAGAALALRVGGPTNLRVQIATAVGWSVAWIATDMVAVLLPAGWGAYRELPALAAVRGVTCGVVGIGVTSAALRQMHASDFTAITPARFRFMTLSRIGCAGGLAVLGWFAAQSVACDVYSSAGATLVVLEGACIALVFLQLRAVRRPAEVVLLGVPVLVGFAIRQLPYSGIWSWSATAGTMALGIAAALLYAGETRVKVLAAVALAWGAALFVSTPLPPSFACTTWGIVGALCGALGGGTTITLLHRHLLAESRDRRNERHRR